MEKKIIYLTNILFLLCDKYISRPEKIGEKVACAIKQATKMLYPDGPGTTESVIGAIRKEWLDKFTAGLTKVLFDNKEKP